MSVRWYFALVEPKVADPEKKAVPLFRCETVEPHNVLVCQEMKFRKFARFDNMQALLAFKSKVKYSHDCLYEIIRGRQPHKWYCDLDILIEENASADAKAKNKFMLPLEEAKKVVPMVKKALMEVLPMLEEKHLLVATSSDAVKSSHHIVTDKWCVASCEEAKAIFLKVLDRIPERYRGALDHGMYKSLQQFRLYGSHKWNSERVKVFSEDYCNWETGVVPVDEKHLEILRFSAFLLGNVSTCSYLPSFLADKPSRFQDNELSTIDKPTVEGALHLFRIGYENSGVFTYLSYEKCFIKLKRHRSSFCNICQRSHQHENPYLYVMGKYRHVYFDCRRSGPDKPKLYLGMLGMDSSYVQPEPNKEQKMVITKPSKKSVLAGLVAGTVHGYDNIITIANSVAGASSVLEEVLASGEANPLLEDEAFTSPEANLVAEEDSSSEVSGTEEESSSPIIKITSPTIKITSPVRCDKPTTSICPPFDKNKAFSMEDTMELGSSLVRNKHIKPKTEPARLKDYGVSLNRNKRREYGLR